MTKPIDLHMESYSSLNQGNRKIAAKELLESFNTQGLSLIDQEAILTVALNLVQLKALNLYSDEDRDNDD